MDDSQSSYAFSNSPSIISCSSSSVIIDANDAMSYDSLLMNTKASLSNSAQINDVSFSRHFSGLLEDCRLCISQSLDLVGKLLLNAETQLSKLTEYMEDAVCLLHLLSSLIKNMVESISLSCSSFRTFPTTTGRILLLVFTHCKNSETTYGLHLSNVQKQLKDLFRTCHELQLTYLMVLEKQFVFDLIEGEELDILIEALNINLKIGEVVQSLDVKTMAEQWKAYTALCEKYSNNLLDKQTYQECAQLLCDMIRHNLKNALELDQDEKIVLRSLKVTNFMMKISLKISNTFKHAAVKDFAPVLDLLIYIFIHNPAFLESIEGRPVQFINGILTNVCNPLDLLLKELIMDEKFLNVVLAFNIKELNDEKLLGYTCLIIGIMKCSLQKSEAMPSFPKHKLLKCVIRALSHCQVWLNMGLRFQNESITSEQTFGLFEHMLIYAASLAATMNCEEMYHLEKTMYGTVLGTDTVSAMFISNLWAVVARISNNRLMLLSQVLSLCQIYQKLENHKIFLYSPQKLHISHTMCALFEVMRIEDRIKVFEQFNPLDSRNATIWSVLKIKNLNKDLQRNIQDNFLEQYRNLSTRALSEQSIDELIKIMKVASSFAYPSTDDMDECLVLAWMRACPKNYTFISNSLDCGTLWYFEYTEALVLWTFAMHNSFYDNTQNLTKILHVISSIIRISNSELNLLLIDLLCKLATFTLHGQNKHTATSLVSESFRMLALNDNSIVRNKFFRVVSTCDNKRLEQIMHSTLGREFQEAWNDYVKFKTVKDYEPIKLKEILLVGDHFEFSHKCIETRLDNEHNSETVDQLPRTCSSNFEFADLDTLFDLESNAEPASKKMKLESSETESILKRLEAETSVLCNLKENVFTSEHKMRIQDVCENLKRIVT